jgi:integral membrane protein
VPAVARWFRVIAVVEAVSWTALLVAMVLKWLVHAPHEGYVPVVGPIHGVGFVVYVLSTLLAAWRLRWTASAALVGVLAGVPPFGTIVFERWAQRTGRLHAPSAAARTPEPARG